ncbi:uncharacterized protein [Temnothorax longispinosus]|uniref:uncharacterized protein n=1 Tax=Temnothorax longispinosus TaxID=300112 RepID=UPI003A993767
MRQILLAITLLSIAVSENILMENHPRLKTAWICDKQLWNRKTKRIPRKDVPSKIEESLNYEDDRQFPQISDTRFTDESRKLPAIIRRHDLARFPQDDLSFDKSKLDSIKPRVLISIGIQEDKNVGNDLQEDCLKRKNYCQDNWQIQQPFYVEEPTWVDIDIDYIDSSQRDNSDPYILTRGKKIYRIKDTEQAIQDKTIEDYEAALGYPSRNKKFLIKNRVRRFAKTNRGAKDKTTDVKNNQIKERYHYDSLQDIIRDVNNTIIEMENSGEKSFKIDKILEEAEKPKDTSYVFIKKYEKNDLKNLAKRSLRGFKFTKQNQIFANGIITDLVQKKQKIQRKDIPNDIETGSNKTAKIDQIGRFNNSKSHLAININKRNKRSMLLKNQELPDTRKKHDIYEIDANPKKNIEQNGIYKQMKLKAYVNKLNDPGTPNNFFILSRNKDPYHNGIENLNEKDTDRKSIEKAWKLYYAHRKKLESEREVKNEGGEINKDNIGITDSQLINESNLKNSDNSEIKISNYREKRNACKTCKIKPKIKPQFQQDKWLMDIERKIQQSLSLERRDKHSDILERLTEPYFISRGKKVPQDFEKDVLSSMLNSRNLNDVEPYFISRGKKVPQDFEKDVLSSMLNSRNLNDEEPYFISRGKKVPQDFEKDVLSSMLNSRNINDEDRAKIMSLSVVEGLLRILLMETSRCNGDNCDINANRLSDVRLPPRDRRGTLDEIFAAYDPYYVARGKRVNRN